MPPGAAAPPPPLGRPADNAQALRKQRAAVEAIAADNAALKEELMLENKFSVNPTTATAAALLANLQAQADVYAAKITEEQRLRAELAGQVEALQAGIAAQRVQMGGINNSAEMALKVERKVRLLEDRLQQASVRHSEMLARNRALRAAVDGLRRERMLFDALGAKLRRGLEARQADMVDLIARIAEAHEAGEKAGILRGQVKAQADKDVAAYEAEWRHLTDIIEADRRGREAQRARDIAAREAQMAALFKQDFGAGGGAKGGRRSGREGEGGGEAAGGGAAASASAAERVRQLRQELDKVLAATGAPDAGALFEALAAGEEANFALFAYVNDLSGEVEALEEGIGALRAEVQRYRAELAAAASDGEAATLRALGRELAAVEDQADEYEGRHSQAQAAFESLRGAVQELFTRAGCAAPAVLELLGGEGVSERSLVGYLGVLEQRTNELLAQYWAAAAEGGAAASEHAAAVLAGKGAAAQALSYAVEPPSSAAGAPAGILPRTDSREGGEEGVVGAVADRPLSRGSLAVAARAAVRGRAHAALKIKAVRPQAASSTSGGAGR